MASPGRASAATLAVRRLCSRLGDPDDVRAAAVVSALLVAGEAVLCGLIIWRVPYTEIDWQVRLSALFGGCQRLC